MTELDWGAGSYERIAAQILEASEHAVQAVRPAPGDRVLDLACGTGNAALLAAARGAVVTGLDGSRRLLDVAASRAAEAGVQAEWVQGDAGELPFADGAFDAAVSVFGIIFAADAARAAAELERVVRPGGRIVLATWVDRGPLAEVMAASARAAAELRPGGTPPAAPRVDWGDPAVLRTLFSSEVEIEERTMRFAAESPRAWVEENGEHHPGWLALRAALPPERWAALEDEIEGILRAGNEDPAALRLSSPYLLARVER